jgi:hypothetical protein
MGRARTRIVRFPDSFTSNCGTALATKLVRDTKKRESDVKYNKKKQNEQPGEVLGISNPGGPKLPHPPSDGSTPRGIDVRSERKRHYGTEDIPQSDGATGIDMGGGGDGPQVAAEHPRPKVEDEI